LCCLVEEEYVYCLRKFSETDCRHRYFLECELDLWHCCRKISRKRWTLESLILRLLGNLIRVDDLSVGFP
jgi:hypothetical protein